MTQRVLKLLQVDDNDDDLTLTREALEGIVGLALVHVARNGREALAYLRSPEAMVPEARPDLVLMDINMPMMTGFEALREIRRDTNFRALPVIMMTVSGREEDIVRAYEEGAVTYLRKPLEFSDLVLALHRLEVYWNHVALRPGQRTR